MAQLNMDLGQVEEQTTPEPLPAGDYLAQIVESEIKESQAGTAYVRFVWEIMEQKFAGRMAFDNVSIGNPAGKRYDPGKSPAEIGQRKLKTIAVCGNHPNPNFLRDTEELHNLPMIIKIKVRHDPQYGAQNDVKGYRPARAVQQPSAPSAPAQQSAPQTQAVPPSGGAPTPPPQQQAPPWMQAAR